MKNTLTKIFLTGFLSVLFAAGSAFAADPLTTKIEGSLAKKQIGEVRSLLESGPGNVDAVIKALFKRTQQVMATDPDFSNQMMGLAGNYAAQITPPSVPAICADLRRIIDGMRADQVGTPLFTTVMDVTERFAKAPVVVSSGRPNLCETAWITIANLAGVEDPLLAQLPGMTGPGLPPTTIRPGVPPAEPSDEEKPSAD